MGERYPDHIPAPLAEVLGMPPHMLHPWWAALRAVGVEIPKRYEGEIASALFFLIPFAVVHGKDWRDAAANELDRLKNGGHRVATAHSADAMFEDGQIALRLYLTTDPGPMRECRQTDRILLDESNATELLGTLALALEQLGGERG